MAHDHEDGKNEVSADHLFSEFERQPDAVADAKIEALPLHDRLTSENFERLVARLADPPSGTSVRATRYGKSGSTQGGIDVICMDPLAHKCDYYEGKRRERVAKGDMTTWVDKFLRGPHVSDARKFVLCTTFNIFESTDLTIEWKQCAARLAEHRIDSELWDSAGIHKLLRRRYDIVSELFGDAVADRYCVQEIRALSEPPQRTFEVKRVSQFGRALSMQNVSVACEILLPSDGEVNTGASLSFSRRELSGISISISGQELVHWMQWRAHAQPGSARPYALPMVGDESKVVFAANSARLLLRTEELQHLDWVLQRAWESFHRDVTKQLASLRSARFKRLGGSTGPFVLASVERALWRSMLGYAQEHDVAKGGGPWHIFDGASGCLKVYTPQSTDRFDSGYHAILFAYEEGGICLPWETTVSIGWTVPTNFGVPVDISPRTNWDAEYTHDWLLEEFIPEVLRWKSAARLEPSKSGFLRAAARQAQPKADDVGRFAASSAIGLSLRTVPEDFDGLRACVGALQSHFNGRRSDVDIEPTLAKAVLSAIDRALVFAQLPYEGYLRRALGMSAAEDLVEAIRLRAHDGAGGTSQAAMDFRLRGLLEVMNAVRSAPPGEWRSIAATLQPVLDRYNEDVICDLFTAG